MPQESTLVNSKMFTRTPSVELDIGFSEYSNKLKGISRIEIAIYGKAIGGGKEEESSVQYLLYSNL